MKTKKVLFFLMVFTLSLEVYTQCTDTFPGTLQHLIRNCNSLPNNCLAASLAKLSDSNVRLPSDSITLFFKLWTKEHSFDNSTLFSCYRINKIYSNRSLWVILLKSWEQKNGFVHEICTDLINSGYPSQADTLYQIFDFEGKLDIHDLLNWAKVKGLIRDEKMLPELYARIIHKEPKLRTVALNHFSQILQECSSQLVDTLLNRFGEAYLATSDADTMTIRNWLADMYGRFGLFEQEIKILENYDTPFDPSAYRLIDVARLRYSKGLFREAIAAGGVAYRREMDNESKIFLATVLYQSYLELGKEDSAMIWMERADLKSDERKRGAIILLQNSGQFKRASALIDSLKPSIVRDSLSIRQLIFQGECNKAAELVSGGCISIKRSQMNNAVWTVRTLIFSGKLQEVISYFGTLNIQPSWEYARELLTDKYWVHYLQNAPAALAGWAEIEYNLFKGESGKARIVLEKSQMPQLYKCKLSLNLAKTLNEKGQAAAALQVLGLCNQNDISAEYLYVKAEVLIRLGDIDSAQQILKKVILENSDDPVSEKARILLSSTGKNSR